jgi:hypothetical protein
MAVPDNRIRFSSTRIDFATDVGLSGQDHDSYPPPGGQARYDHLRMFLIGLLAQQASFQPPTQFRDGTAWFDLNTFTLKVRLGQDWLPYANVLGLTEPDSDGQVVTLAEWYAAVQDILKGLSPEVVFSGKCNASDVDTIPIPTSVQTNLGAESRVFLYINGSLVDPHNCALIGTPPTTLKLSSISLEQGDTFVVVIRRISSTTFLAASVSVP